MPGLILDTAAAVGDIVVSCSSDITDAELIGPGQSKSRGEITGHLKKSLTRHDFCLF